MGNIYESLLSELKKRNKAVMLTVTSVDENEQPVIKKSIIDFGNFETNEAGNHIPKGNLQDILALGLPEYIFENGELLLFEPFYREPRLIVLGGGHIALPLVEIGSIIGFSVAVADDRPFFANATRFPKADKVICDGFENAIDKLEIAETDYVVIITRGHRHDADCLKRLVDKKTAYLGMIGSRRRVQFVKEQLIEEGYDGKKLEALKAPIGLAIGAQTPEEIAVSIIAQVISEKRLQNAENPKIQSQSDYDVLERLAKEQAQKRAIVTVLSTKGSVPRNAGAKMIVYPDGSILGSIGGGCSEAGVIREALDLFQTGGYKKVQVDLTAEAAEDEGMVCGGIMEILIEVF